MPPSRRQKIGWAVVWTLVLALALYVSYCLSGLFQIEGLNADNYKEHALYLLQHPLEKNYYNDKTPYILLASAFTWFLGALWNYSGLHDLRLGEEHGTSKWGSIKRLNKQLACLMTGYFLCFPRKVPDAGKNRIISEHLRISYDTSKTLLNNNILVIGGSGSGKTAFFIIPNLLVCFGSNVFADPKGMLIKELGNYLLAKGVRVLSLNLVDMQKSCQYNPFLYIRKPSDVNKLVTNLIANTTPANASYSDPFWIKAEKMYVTAIFLYVWMECPRKEMVKRENGIYEEITLDRSFRTVLFLLDEAQVHTDPDKKSPLDIRMNRLAALKGENHPAVRSYRRCIRGAGDTVRSIIISANARFDPFDDEDLLRILDGDDIDIPSLAVGLHGDRETQTALFICIPDDDDTYNFIPGMLYTQLFQELYRQARLYGGKCPIPVGIYLDEFANTKMPNSFEKILATCRSRDIYCLIFLQSLAQLKAEYKEERWEGILGNCDIIVYLGGNEPSGHKHMSEQTGEETIEKRSQGESRGGRDSSSSNYDVMGRKLLTTDEVSRLKDRCICFIRGEYPVMDQKWNYYTKHRKLRKQLLTYGEYEQSILIEKEGARQFTLKPQPAFTALKDQSLVHYQLCREHGEPIEIYQMEYKDFLQYDFDTKKADAGLLRDLQEAFQKKEAAKGKKQTDTTKQTEQQTKQAKKTDKEVFQDYILSGNVSMEKLEALKRGLHMGLSHKQLRELIDKELDAGRLHLILDVIEMEE